MKRNSWCNLSKDGRFTGMDSRGNPKTVTSRVSALAGCYKFQNLVSVCWNSNSFQGSADYILKEKLKALKNAARIWYKNDLEVKTRRHKEISKELLNWDEKAEQGIITEVDCQQRDDWIFELLLLEQSKKADLFQKSRTKWAIEGDENTSFFHSLVNHKWRKNKIAGLIVDGQWTSEPSVIKNAFYKHFAERFKEPCQSRPRFYSHLFKKISPEDVSALEAPFSVSEIKEAVWSCNGSKAPGPEVLNFNFIKKFWPILENTFVNAISKFERTGCIGKGCNASFVSLIPKRVDPIVITDFRPINLLGCSYKIIAKILARRLALVLPKVISGNQTAFIAGRQILDGCLIANEIVQFAIKKKMKMFLFKVDFEKAFDSVNWHFLLRTMEQMGFGSKWIGWIRGCLQSASTSVLINGSPTEEFRMNRGLRQGDPLSPYLFLMAGEVLQQMILIACEKGLFKGIKLASSKRNLSLLQFADDALIFGKWTNKNIVSLSKILNCFYEVSGLRINFSKSKLFGIGVSDSEVEAMATKIKCQSSSFPFTYLGLPVGENMRKKAAWSVVIEKVKKKLNAWKSKCLSIGGRFTLIQSVLTALPLHFFSLFKAPSSIIKSLDSIRRGFFWGFSEREKKLHWIAWNDVQTPASKGLGVTNLQFKNDALLAKWIWRFLSFEDAIWKDVISELYGKDGGIFNSRALATKSTWASIINCCKGIVLQNQSFIASFKKTIAFGSKTPFWKDAELGHGSKLKEIFPRLYALAKNKDACFKDRGRALDDLQALESLLSSSAFRSEGSDKWSWVWDKSGSFTVKQLSKLLHNTLASNTVENDQRFWSNLIPKKINIFLWRLFRGAVPIKWNLSKRGITIPSLDCVLCGNNIETLDHCFFTCSLSSAIWKKVWAWWGIKSPLLTSVSSFKSMVQRMGTNRKLRVVFSSVCAITLWQIWRWRNSILFATDDAIIRKRSQDPFPSIQILSKLWIGSRNKKWQMNLSNWITAPGGDGHAEAPCLVSTQPSLFPSPSTFSSRQADHTTTVPTTIFVAAGVSTTILSWEKTIFRAFSDDLPSESIRKCPTVFSNRDQQPHKWYIGFPKPYDLVTQSPATGSEPRWRMKAVAPTDSGTFQQNTCALRQRNTCAPMTAGVHTVEQYDGGKGAHGWAVRWRRRCRRRRRQMPAAAQKVEAEDGGGGGLAGGEANGDGGLAGGGANGDGRLAGGGASGGGSFAGGGASDGGVLLVEEQAMVGFCR
ncbi:hypothetical protein OSB04_005066 [Centaurea solstitialis]|uniref:Reverse transcriptase domain-containing protein n=1 Tax=Centaurea solstitialis TaxID=347529 RepID=A0AA38TT58_9ASTR|nr:hypothetical protein OSB04_005066 [Centaurea solstitialis]